MSKFREFLQKRGLLKPYLEALPVILDNLDEYLDHREQQKWTPLREPGSTAAVRDHYDRIIASTNHQLIQDRELLKEQLREVERQSAFLSAAVTQENQKAREFSKQYVETAQRLARFRGEWVPPCYSDPLTGYWKLGFDHRPGEITYVGKNTDMEVLRSMTPQWIKTPLSAPMMVEGDLYPCHPALYHGVQQVYGDPVTVGHWLDRR